MKLVTSTKVADSEKITLQQLTSHTQSLIQLRCRINDVPLTQENVYC